MSLHLALGPEIHAEMHILHAFPCFLWRRGTKKDWKFLPAPSGTDQCDVTLQNCSLVMLPASDKRILSPQAREKRKLWFIFLWQAGKGVAVVLRTMQEAALWYSEVTFGLVAVLESNP